MSTDDSQRTMNGYMEALLAGQDFGSFFADDVVWTTMETGEQIHGRTEVADFIGALHTQMFDARPEVVTLLCGDGVALLEAVFAAKHTGEFAGIPATGTDVRMPYCVGYDTADGKITSLRAYFPVTSLHQQLTNASGAAG